MKGDRAVVPYYFLVWYNTVNILTDRAFAVVPYYFLVWYNYAAGIIRATSAVVPYYFLVWYNLKVQFNILKVL